MSQQYNAYTAALEKRIQELETQQVELENRRKWLEYMVESARQYRDKMEQTKPQQPQTQQQIEDAEAELFVNTVLRRDLL